MPLMSLNFILKYNRNVFYQINASSRIIQVNTTRLNELNNLIYTIHGDHVQIKSLD